MYRRTLFRVLAAFGGAALLVVAAWGVVWIFLLGAIAAQAPDPFVADGDPCCGHPDTWGEVATGVAWTLGCALVDALLLCVGVALLVWAVRQRWPRPKRLALLPAAGVAGAGVVLAAVLIPQLDEGRPPPDCGTFAFDRIGWRSTDEEAQKTNAYGVARCHLLEGRSKRQVRELLGPPATRGRVGGQTYWSFSGLDVFFEDGRAVAAHAGAS